MKTTCLRKTTLRLPTGWLRTFHLLVLALLLPVRTAADPDPDPNLPRDATVSLGATVSFLVSASTTNPPLSYQWQHQGTNLDGATLTTLGLTNVTELDAGGYQAIIWNVGGNSATSRVAKLTVDPTYTQITTGPIPKEAGILANWIDYDQDGHLDLYVVRDSFSPPLVYHNNGEGSFTRIMTGVLPQTAALFWGTVWADYDNDGRVDLFAPTTGTMNDMQFHNEGNGDFTRIVTGPQVAEGGDCLGAIWTDYDRDGFLDLFVSTYSGQNDLFYGNKRDGTFRKLTAADLGPVVTDAASTEWLLAVDVDNDGIQELSRSITTSLGSTNELWGFDQAGRYVPKDIGELAYSIQYGGLTWADYDNDGFQDGLTGVTGAPFRLFRNLQGRGFTDVTASAGLPALNAVGGLWSDYDNDGWLDFFIAEENGITALCRNNGDGTFATKDIGSPLRGYFFLGFGDYDNDGFQDLVGGNFGGIRCALFRHNGNTNHWLKVLLDGRASNRSGIGAKVRAHATIKGRTFWQMREISGQSFGLDNGLIAHFGLGDATKVDTLRIEWPSGIVQELKDVAVNQKPYLTVRETQNPPLPPPQVTASGLTAEGTFQATATYATMNFLCVLEASTNLVQWTKLSVRTNTTGTVQFDDPGATNRPARFYRVVVP